jgi:hypothetical protein
VARFDQAGTMTWLKQVGTPAADEFWALTGDGSGGVVLTGYTAGNFATDLAGDKEPDRGQGRRVRRRGLEGPGRYAGQ